MDGSIDMKNMKFLTIYEKNYSMHLSPARDSYAKVTAMVSAGDIEHATTYNELLKAVQSSK